MDAGDDEEKGTKGAMNDMHMSDAEIATGYRTAKNKTKQIGVLAELNVVSRRTMEEKLVELGLMEKTGGVSPSRPRPRRRRRLPSTRSGPGSFTPRAGTTWRSLRCWA